MFKKIKHIHFVGIGGSGMSGIAEVLLKLGYEVTGSDLNQNAEATRLQGNGAVVYIGHAPRNIDGADVVVTSTAISKSNVEVIEAQKKGIPVIPRIEMLAEIARLKYTIAISGTHGKTTTTSMVGQVLKQAGLDPTVVVGGRLKAVGTGGVLGTGDYLVAEADESDGSFLKLSPTIAIVTNIDNDHLDYYKTQQRLLESFVSFASHIPFYGICYLCREDPGVRKILPKLRRRFATYGFSEGCDLRAVKPVLNEEGTRFDVVFKKKRLGSVRLTVPGLHNVLNALAAVAVGLHLDIAFEEIALALSQFEGVGRRLEIKGEAQGITVVDDYGHHPTEIKATLAAVRTRWPKRRIVVIFQPHRFTRTKLLAKEFAAALQGADRLYLMPIYPAGEKPIAGVSSKIIGRGLKGKHWVLWETGDMRRLAQELKSGDLLLTLGAGDVWKVGEHIVKSSSPVIMRLERLLPALASRVKPQEPLSRHCTWAIGGAAEAYIEVQTLKELKDLQAVCREEHIPIFLLGWGSNVLLPDEGLNGCVVRLRGEFESVQFEGTEVTVGAGVHLPKLARMCAEKGLAGVEALAGVPGTVGGALMTNAGTPRGVIGDVVLSVDVLNPDGSIEVVSKEDIRFAYRESSLLGRWIVSARLGLGPSQNGEVEERLRFELEQREKTQPLGTKNVGSTFKNPPHDFAARLIEEAGLKGFQLGRVRFSPKHANFIENLGGATSKEAIQLMTHAQNVVREKFNVQLEPEVIIISPTSPSALTAGTMAS